MDRPRAFLNWAAEMFGPIAHDQQERTARFTEEAIELAHAMYMPAETVQKIIERVYARPRGAVPKEIGQAQACLETLALSVGLSADTEAQIEWERVQKIPREEWERRHSAKVALGIASN